MLNASLFACFDVSQRGRVHRSDRGRTRRQRETGRSDFEQKSYDKSCRLQDAAFSVTLSLRVETRKVGVRMSPFDMARSSSVAAGVHPCGVCTVRPLTVCAVLDDEEIGRLADLAQTQRVESNQTIFSEGDLASGVFNVTSGTVKVYKLLQDGRRQITGFLFGGDFMGLSTHDRYVYSAESVNATTMCRFPRRQLDRLMDEFPKLQRQLFSLASSELAAAQDQMLLLGRKTAGKRSHLS